MINLISFWSVLKRLLSYGMIWKKFFIIALFLLLFASITEVIGPILISYFINNIISLHLGSIKKICFFILTFIILQIISAYLYYLQSIVFNKTALKIVQKLRCDVMQAALFQPISVFDTQPIGQIISKITNDTELIKELYDTVIATTMRSMVLIIITIIAMFSLEWHMAIISIIIFPLVILIMITYQHYSTPILRKVRYYVANLNNKFNEYINGMNVIQQFNQEKKFRFLIKKVSYSHYLERMKILKLDGFLLRPLLSLISSFILCSLILLISFMPNEIFEVGTLYAFMSYLGRLSEPLITISSQQSILQQAIVAGERIFELIDSPKEQFGEKNLPIKKGKIKIENLNFKYESNKVHVLKNINLKISKKKFVAFVGHTGSGKSTLANLLMGYYPIKTGKILIDGNDINHLSYNSIKKGILMVQQEPVILADTFFENITLGKKISEYKLWKILDMVHLSSLVNSFPNGIHSLLGEQGNNLSVGQKQLIALARVLVRKPKILILDEATASIDSETEKSIQKTLLSIKRKTTLIIIAHRLSTVVNADYIIVLQNGTIIEEGSHKALLEMKGKYWRMQKFQSL
ncbi:SmdB family multidrug efflux ABC transporter permease/ATP-binding protein [Buchnera aphidicola (Mindarus keteleerifoliae)]|uniref:SmdB family multidrug efflux ABC transporter permease/ATP-binding protein n=1 Tax=Buchnera aphidicola TaxID=9 RepID=UPI0031B70A12